MDKKEIIRSYVQRRIRYLLHRLCQYVQHYALDFSTPVTGTLFFVPSYELLDKLGE